MSNEKELKESVYTWDYIMIKHCCNGKGHDAAPPSKNTNV